MQSVQTQMVALHVSVKMDIQEMEQHVHCKNWFVDLTNILLYRLHVANLVWYKSKHNTVFITNIPIAT